MNSQILLKVIEESCKRNGEEKIITLSHLRNLIDFSIKIERQEEKKQQSILDEAYNDAMSYRLYGGE